MRFITKHKEARAPEIAAPTLEDVLVDLQRFGRPWVSMLDSGWHCWVKMHVAGAGTSFEVKSDFGHKSPTAAALECSKRVHETMAAFGA